MGQPKRIDRELCHRLYAEMRNYAAVHRELNARGIAAVYGTVRSIISGKQDNGRQGWRPIHHITVCGDVFRGEDCPVACGQ